MSQISSIFPIVVPRRHYNADVVKHVNINYKQFKKNEQYILV